MSSQDISSTSQQGTGGCGCGCGTSPAAEQAVADAGTGRAGDVRTRYAVDGMTCGHCVSAVTEELGALPGVRGVEITLVAGGTSTVEVTSGAPLDPEAVRAAVDEAGYALVRPAP
ncbi:hypothetical protein NUM3379_24080 [Kineococcus sp. NUM-3379]